MLARPLLMFVATTLVACSTTPPPAAPTTRESVAASDETTAAASSVKVEDHEPESALAAPRVGEGVLVLKLEGEAGPFTEAVATAWVEHAAAMVTEYYNGFPVPKLEVTVLRRGGSGVGFGQHQDGKWIRVRVGRRTSQRVLERDWVMVHEMLHAAFPDLTRPHKWMQEGLSTYLESIVRARAGVYTEEEVWKRWVDMMPNGRPRAGDRGLDLTRTWGRLYWGGALFWMMTDLELRKQTDNQKSLRDALQGIVAAGGNGRADWTTAKVRSVADEATGTTAVSDVYARMALAPGDVDLDQLWKDLGVIAHRDGSITFDDTAPLARFRRSMVVDE